MTTRATISILVCAVSCAADRPDPVFAPGVCVGESTTLVNGGPVDRHSTVVADSLGRPLLETVFKSDESVYERSVEYGPHGVRREAVVTLDRHEVRTVAYDPRGHVVQEERSGADGPEEYAVQTRWTRDDEGREHGREVVSDIGDTRVVSVLTTTWDGGGAGHPLRVW